MGICFTWNIEKNSKKTPIVSRETLYIYAFICIFIQIKGVEFCGIQIYKYTNCIQIYKYTCTRALLYTSIQVFVYTCLCVYLYTIDTQYTC